MKVGAVSGDLLVKLALGAAAVGAVVWAIAKLRDQVPSPDDLWRAVVDAADTVNPLNHDNVFAVGVNRYGASIVTDPAGPGKNADGSWSLGGWAFDVFHPGVAARRDNFGGGATGSW